MEPPAGLPTDSRAVDPSGCEGRTIAPPVGEWGVVTGLDERLVGQGGRWGEMGADHGFVYPRPLWSGLLFPT